MNNFKSRAEATTWLDENRGNLTAEQFWSAVDQIEQAFPA